MSRFRGISRAVLTATIISAVTLAALAETPQEKGHAIAARSDASDAGFGTQSAKLKMVLSDPSGRTTTRLLRIDTLEKVGDGNGDKSLTVFFSPRDVDGTALLSHARILEPDNQWLYLPALRRIKRISSANKSGPFVGSEFAFEDLTASELGKFSYTYLETRMVDGVEMDVLECKPLYPRSGYSKLTCYFDTEAFQSRKIEFYDRGGQHLKTLTLMDYRQYEGRYWRSHRQLMTNHLTGKTTLLEFEDFDFGSTLEPQDFEPAALGEF